MPRCRNLRTARSQGVVHRFSYLSIPQDNTLRTHSGCQPLTTAFSWKWETRRPLPRSSSLSTLWSLSAAGWCRLRVLTLKSLPLEHIPLKCYVCFVLGAKQLDFPISSSGIPIDRWRSIDRIFLIVLSISCQGFFHHLVNLTCVLISLLIILFLQHRKKLGVRCLDGGGFWYRIT